VKEGDGKSSSSRSKGKGAETPSKKSPGIRRRKAEFRKVMEESG